MKCKICLSPTRKKFSKRVLGTYLVSYYQCSKCNFLQTEEPYWLEEAYSSGAISALDTGILYRNFLLRERTKAILLNLYENFYTFQALDYGGGEGIFVRMMRDMGFNFYRQDLYADNLYARFFDILDLPKGSKFDVLTTFEVFEHLVDPIAEIKKMLTYSDIIIFSTELQPSDENSNLEDWWYIVPETGQHISFYTVTSLKQIGDKLGLNLYTDHLNLHIFSKQKLDDPFKFKKLQVKKANFFRRIINKFIKKLITVEKKSVNKGPTSLTIEDFYLVKMKLSKEHL